MPRSPLGAAWTFLLALALAVPSTARAQQSVGVDSPKVALPLTPARWARFTTSQGVSVTFGDAPRPDGVE